MKNYVIPKPGFSQKNVFKKFFWEGRNFFILKVGGMGVHIGDLPKMGCEGGIQP